MRMILARAAAGAALFAAAFAAHAGGPLGICYTNPIKYPGAGSVTLRYDGGGTLGTRTKAQADTIVSNAIAYWTNVSTATVTLSRGADLPVDVTTANFNTYYGNFSDGINPVIYDTDGSIVNSLFGGCPGGHPNCPNDHILGFAGSAWSDNGSVCQYVEGHAVINGFIPVSDTTMTNVIAHEVGHLIGMDHTQPDDGSGVPNSTYPLMYPIAYRGVLSLHEDDTAAVTALYPGSNVNTVYGELSGTFTTAGGTPIRGANIYAQGTGGTFSVISDYRMQNTGYFRLLLPPGTYTLRAGVIRDTDFTGGSGIGPYADDWTSASFQPPLYSVGGTSSVAPSGPMATATLGGGTPTQITITAGCAATATFHPNGTGNIGGNCVPALPPAAPGSLAPVGTVTTLTPTYSWNASANATSYTLLIQNASGTVATLPFSTSQAGCPGGGVCSVTPSTTLVTLTSYTWAVSASNSNGTSAYSVSRSFDVLVGTPPDQPTTLTPVGTIGTATPTYTWNAVPNATSYDFLVQTLLGVVINTNYTATQAGCASGSGTCSVTPSAVLDQNVKVNWFVAARNPYGASAWSAKTQIIVSTGTVPSNVALASAGAVASVSSAASASFPASALNNGDRKGLNWGAGGGWKDATLNAYPDWAQIDFNGSKTIDRVIVYSLQDTPGAPVEPTDTLTFMNFGVTSFVVEGWNGTAWTTLATVTGNNLVKRTVTFAAFTASGIRVTINNAIGGYSRLAEIEAFGVDASPAPSVNVALASAGSTATASSSAGASFPVASLINGDRAGLNWGAGGGWKDATSGAYPDWVQVDFGTTRTIDSVIVYSLQDSPATPVDPSDTMTFASFGVTAFVVEGWNGSAWISLGTVSGNNLVKRKVTFSPAAVSSVRVTINNAIGGFSRLTEIESWGH